MALIARPGTTACKIYVGPLTQNTTDLDLRRHFQGVGLIREAVVLKDKADPTKSRGFGFVVFHEEKHVQEAIEKMNRTTLNKNQITVAIAGTGGASKPERTERNTERDWTCEACSISNFCFRMLCYRCGGPRPASATNWGMRGTVKAGDWICRGCHRPNLPINRVCRHCAKPMDVPEEQKAVDPPAQVSNAPLFSPKDTALMASYASNFVASIGASNSGAVGQANYGSYGNMGGVNGAGQSFGGGMSGGAGQGPVVGPDGVVVSTGRGMGYDKDGNKLRLKRSDWQCPVCWAPNNKYREQCNINGCEGKKPPRKMPPSVAEVGQNLRRMKWEDGDWECPVCANHNFKNRDVCNGNRCTEPRPFSATQIPNKQQQRGVTIAPKEWSWY